jgi:hypothetical protein
MGSEKFPTHDQHPGSSDANNPYIGSNNGNSGNKDEMDNKNGMNVNSRKQLDIQIGFYPYSKKLGAYDKSREMIIGLFYSGSDLRDRNSLTFTDRAGATFTNNSNFYQTDTISRTHKTFREKANVLGLSFQYLYKTDPERRISLFAGYGVKAGYALNARYFREYRKDSVAVINFAGANPKNLNFATGLPLGVEELSTSSTANTTFVTSVFIPIGINYRLSKTRDIWNQMSLFYEGSFGLESQIVVARRAHFAPYMGSSIGFKFTF